MNLSQKEFEAEYPVAYSNLPEAYQNDSCLEFFIDGDLLFAYDDSGTEYLYNERGMCWEATGIISAA